MPSPAPGCQIGGIRLIFAAGHTTMQCHRIPAVHSKEPHVRIRMVSLQAALLALIAHSVYSADEAPKPADPGTLLVIDQAGKEHKLKAWKFSTGTRHLSWLAPAPPREDKEKDDNKQKGKEPAKAKAAVGPEALEFRDDRSTNFA